MHTLNRAASLVVVGVLTLATTLQAQSVVPGFDPLFRVLGDKDTCQVKKAGSEDFEPVVKGKAYSFGSIVRTDGGEATIFLSSEDTVQLSSQAELTVGEPDGAPANTKRILWLTHGKVELSVREILPDPAVRLETPVASCDSFAKKVTVELSKIRKDSKEKLDQRLIVHTDNGEVRVLGAQFVIPKLKPASTVRIEASTERNITRIIDEVNDFKVDIDNGTDTPLASLDTNVRGTVRISREHAAVGGKLVVSVLAPAPDGTGKENFSFVPGDPTLISKGLPQTEARGVVESAPAAGAASKTNTTESVSK